jgi:hypothetical protein
LTEGVTGLCLRLLKAFPVEVPLSQIGFVPSLCFVAFLLPFAFPFSLSLALCHELTFFPVVVFLHLAVMLLST